MSLPVPPLKLTLESLQSDVLPAAGGAALVLCLFLVLGRWAAAIGAAAAVTVAFMAANFTLDNVGFEDEPTWDNTGRLIPWKPGENAPGWHWLPRAALLLVGVGLVTRWVGLLAGRFLPERRWWAANVLVWVPRIVAVVVVSEWIASGKAASAPEWEWLRYQLAATMLLVWVALDGFARSGAGAEVAAYSGACFFAAAVVLIYAHSKFFMDLAVVFSFAMFGIAAAARVGRSDASGAIPAAATFLAGLMFAVRPSMSEHKVPEAAFWLVALAPLVLLPFLVPALARRDRWYWPLLRVALLLAPLAVALYLADKYEVLAFGEEG